MLSDGESVQLATLKPIKGVVLDVAEGEEEVAWGDQGIDLVPGDPQVILAKGLKGREVKVRFLGDGAAEPLAKGRILEAARHGGEGEDSKDSACRCCRYVISRRYSRGRAQQRPTRDTDAKEN